MKYLREIFIEKMNSEFYVGAITLWISACDRLLNNWTQDENDGRISRLHSTPKLSYNTLSAMTAKGAMRIKVNRLKW